MIVHHRFQGRRLGYRLVDTVVGIGQEKGLEQIYRFVLSENSRMTNMCTKLGWAIEPQEEAITRASLTLPWIGRVLVLVRSNQPPVANAKQLTCDPD